MWPATNGRFAMQCSQTELHVPVKSGAELCLPEESADVPGVSNAERSGDFFNVVFHAEHCGSNKLGFSTDHVVGGNKAVMEKCLWNGTFSVPAECHGLRDLLRQFCWKEGAAQYICGMVPMPGGTFDKSASFDLRWKVLVCEVQHKLCAQFLRLCGHHSQW